MADANYPALIADFKRLGKRYTKAQLADPNWVIKEIARLGYSIVIRHDTAERYLEQVKAIGKADPDKPFFQENYDSIKEMGGMFTYMVYGGILYADGQGHGSPICSDLHEAVLLALHNIVRLEAELPK